MEFMRIFPNRLKVHYLCNYKKLSGDPQKSSDIFFILPKENRLHFPKKQFTFAENNFFTFYNQKSDFMASLKHPIREAERYLQNARQILSEKAEKDGDYYNDIKYVKMAGNTALHKSLGYDGITDYKIVQSSLDKAKILLDWADKQYQN